jgi:hypothetical protein
VVPFHEALRPAIPAGYGHDYVNMEVLLDRMTVKDGRIELPGGASYALLVVPDAVRSMSIPVLRKLQALVQGGANIVAPRPQALPGLVGERAVFDELVGSLWGATDGHSIAVNPLGKGKVHWGRDVADVLDELKVAPDLQWSQPLPDSSLVGAHRRDGGTDIYFVANQKARAERITASFRVDGRRPELFHADSGKIEPASWQADGKRTNVTLDLQPDESVFVVFRAAAEGKGHAEPVPAPRVTATLNGPWTLQFPGMPAAAVKKLDSWSTFADPAQRYFSGTATYRTTFTPAAVKPGQRVLLDLGQVDVIAQVLVNGKPAGTLWKPPYRADVTGLLKAGANTVEVKVTNLWANRLIGDTAADGGKPATFTTFKPYRPGAALLPSGLAGPVRVLVQDGAATR